MLVAMLIITVISTCAGVVGVAFGIWKYFSSRKISEVRYEISQLSDYKIPAEFLEGLARAPIVVRAQSTGTKAAENVVFKIKMRFPVDKCEVDPSGLEIKIANNEVQLSVARLNPGQSVRMFMTCNGDPLLEQVNTFEFTHVDGPARPFASADRTVDSNQILITALISALVSIPVTILLIWLLQTREAYMVRLELPQHQENPTLPNIGR